VLLAAAVAVAVLAAKCILQCRLHYYQIFFTYHLLAKALLLLHILMYAFVPQYLGQP
jgi:hypothetical protein